MTSQPNWDHLHCLLALHDAGSMTAAAKHLGLSLATFGRRIDALEQALDLKLVNRSATGSTLTHSGQSLVDKLKPGAAYFAQADRIAQTLKQAAEHHPIRISSTEPMITDILAPHISSLLSMDKNLRLELESSVRNADLSIGETDIAIRLAQPKLETLIARKLPSIKMGLFASDVHLAGRKVEALNLEDETLLWIDTTYGDIPENVWLTKRHLDNKAVIRSTSVKALLVLAQNHNGIALLPEFLATRFGLTKLPQYSLSPRQPYLVFHRTTRNHPRMKYVRKWINQTCKTVLSG